MGTMKASIYCLTFLSFLATGFAITCFECNSHTDPACADEFQGDSEALQNSFLKECPPKQEGNETIIPFCRKVKMDVYIANSTRIQRDCGYERRQDYDCYKKRSEDYIVDVCQCDEDMCNGANSFVFAPVLAVFVPLFAKFL